MKINVLYMISNIQGINLNLRYGNESVRKLINKCLTWCMQNLGRKYEGETYKITQRKWCRGVDYILLAQTSFCEHEGRAFVGMKAGNIVTVRQF